MIINELQKIRKYMESQKASVNSYRQTKILLTKLIHHYQNKQRAYF